MSSYRFVDSIESVHEFQLPAEAMSFNGSYLERLIPGYRTLNVSGRESIPTEISTIESGISDGNRFLRRRYTPRTITVRYQLIAETASAFRLAYNKLNSVLDQTEAQIIFADEPDKYYIGSRTELSEVPPGLNSVTGEIEIFCSDPFKYALEETTVAADAEGVFSIDYDGTYPAYPKITAEVNSDLGFVGYLDDKEHIIQIGDPDEVDGEDLPESQTLINDSFTSSMPSGWSVNSAVLEQLAKPYYQIGTTKRNSNGVMANSYGTNNSYWHGPTITKQLPTDQLGNTGSKNFTVSFDHLLYANAAKMLGEIMIWVTGTINGTKQVLASMHFHKSSLNNKTGSCNWNLLSAKKGGTSFDISQANKYTGTKGGKSSYFSKFGDVFTFCFCGKSYQYRLAGSEDYEVTELSVFFEQYKNNPAITMNALKSIRFVTHHVGAYVDVPNKFQNGDVILADCKSGEIYVNDTIQHGAGALGNDWESFCLTPGANQIKCIYSDWGESTPTFSLTYRKAYL